jgi:hypothetical protein
MENPITPVGVTGVSYGNSCGGIVGGGGLGAGNSRFASSVGLRIMEAT